MLIIFIGILLHAKMPFSEFLTIDMLGFSLYIVFIKSTWRKIENVQ